MSKIGQREKTKNEQKETNRGLISQCDKQEVDQETNMRKNVTNVSKRRQGDKYAKNMTKRKGKEIKMSKRRQKDKYEENETMWQTGYIPSDEYEENETVQQIWKKCDKYEQTETVRQICQK